MRQHQPRPALALGVLALFGIAVTSLAKPPGPDAERVVADWKARQAAFKTVRYSLTGTQVITSHLLALGDRPNSGDVTRPEQATVLIDFARGRIRIDRQTHVASGSGPLTVPNNHIYAYGGKELKFFYDRTTNTTPDYTPGDNRPDLTILKATNPVFPEVELHPLFWGHGIVPLPQAPLRADKLAVLPDADQLLLQGPAVHKQQKSLVFRSEASGAVVQYVDYWVANAKGSAILKSIRYSGNKPWSQSEVEYGQTDRNSMPTGWVYTQMLGGKVGKTYRFEVKKVETDVEVVDGDFDIPIQPGMLVSKGDDVIYRAEEGGKLHRITPIPDPNDPNEAQRMRHEENRRRASGELPESSSLLPKVWWCAGGAILALALIAVVFRIVVRHRARRDQTSTQESL